MEIKKSTSKVISLILVLFLQLGLSEEMNKLIKMNSVCQKSIKEKLQAMQADYNDTKKRFPKEPEVRVKNTVH